MKLRLNYFIIPLLVFSVLFIGSFFSLAGMAWHDTLILPKLNPPKSIFPLAWNMLGLLTTASILLFYNRGTRDLYFWIIQSFFAINGFLNIAWTMAFFGWHNIVLAWLIALALEYNLILLISMMYKRSKMAALLLVPYALWVLFALYLNWRIWLLN